MKAGHDEGISQPPSEEALQHLETGIDRATKLVSTVRKQACQLTKDITEAAQHGISLGSSIHDSVSNALDHVEVVEKNHLPGLQNMLTRTMLKTTDASVKTALAEMTRPICDLENTNVSLAALIRQQRQKEQHED